MVKLETQLQETKAELLKQQEKVVRPLVIQAGKMQQQINSLTKDKTELLKTLKVTNAILRAPKLIDLFHKEEQHRMTEARISEANKRAHLTLRQYQVDEAGSK